MTLVTFRARGALSGPLAGANNSHASDASGEATAAEIHARIPDPSSYSAVRAHLPVLEEKGHVRHESRDLRYVYLPTLRPEHARKNWSACRRWSKGRERKSRDAVFHCRSFRLAGG